MNQITFAWNERPDERDFTLAESEQPQQRLENFGVKAVSDTELLAMILQGNGTRPERAVTMASRLIAEAGSIAGLISWEASDYRRTKGIGPIKGLQLAALAEIARRMMTSPQTSAPILNRPELIAEHFAPQVAGLAIEKFWVLLLNRKNRLIKQVEITSGTATAALAHPREVFRAALRERAPVTSLCAVHNHPGGSVEPSAADVNITRVLRDASRAIDIELVDHVIVTANRSPDSKNYYSFREAGLL
jgi:DNA repair protein RadC